MMLEGNLAHKRIKPLRKGRKNEEGKSLKFPALRGADNYDTYNEVPGILYLESDTMYQLNVIVRSRKNSPTAKSLSGISTNCSLFTL